MHSLAWVGILLIFTGMSLLIIPNLGHINFENLSLKEVPSWLVYTYNSKHFYFATSPLLIIISALILALKFSAL